MDNHKAHLKLMAKELAALGAQLQRETRRRATLSSFVQEQSQTNQRLEFVVNKLTRELSEKADQEELLRQQLQDLEQSVESKLYNSNVKLQAALEASITLKAAIKAFQTMPEDPHANGSYQRLTEATDDIQRALQQALSLEDDGDYSMDHHLKCGHLQANIDTKPAETMVDNGDVQRQNNIDVSSSTMSQGPATHLAVRELEAIIPQYRAAASALQGHADVLKAQLATVSKERDALKAELRHYQALAENHEALYASTAAKLYTLDARTVTDTISLKEKCDMLEQQLAVVTNEARTAEDDALKNQQEVQRLQASLKEKERLCGIQEETIHQLEHTIQEQQRDIISALDLAAGGVNINNNSSNRNDDISVGDKYLKTKPVGKENEKSLDEWKILSSTQEEVSVDCDVNDEMLHLKNALTQAIHELKN